MPNILSFLTDRMTLKKYLLNESFLTDFNFRIVEPNRAITKQAAKIRSKYSGIKGMDAIHLATSLYFGCDMFLTNDTQLKQISEVNIVLVDDL